MGGVIGVDEAGRGPVLGSLFVAAIHTPRRDRLPADVDDSKRLEANHRQRLAEQILEDAGIDVAVVEISPRRIDRSVRPLTALVADGFAAAIDRLAAEESTIVVDTGERDTERFARRVERAATASISVTASVGADRSDPAVSAASIVAKEHRERHVDDLVDRYGDIGSGYPSDPTTRAFLASYVDEHMTLPACARRCWQTSRDVLAAAEQATLEGFVAGPPDR